MRGSSMDGRARAGVFCHVVAEGMAQRKPQRFLIVPEADHLPHWPAQLLSDALFHHPFNLPQTPPTSTTEANYAKLFPNCLACSILD